MKFRFSIRELLLVTLIVALGLGWFVRERKLRAEIDQTKAACEATCEAYAERAKKWRGRTGALESTLKRDGWAIRWNQYKLEAEKDGTTFHISTYFYEPSVQDD